MPGADGQRRVSDLAEAIAFFLAVLAYLWWLAIPFPWAGVLVLLAVAVSWRRRSLTPKSLGLGWAEFLASGRRWSVVWIFSLSLFLILGQRKIFGVPALAHGALYFAWAAAQQVVYQSMTYLPLRDYLNRRRLAAGLAGVAFSVMHLPNPILVPATYAWGVASSLLFERCRTAWGLALLQVVLSSTLFWITPRELNRNFRIGPYYWAAPSAPAAIMESVRPVPAGWHNARVDGRLQYFFNGTLITDAGEVRDGAVLVCQGRIEEVGERGVAPPDTELIDAEGGYIAPGFIDLHIHGGGGSDFMDATPADVERVFRFHASHGATALCPTTCAAPLDEILAAIGEVNSYRSRGRRFGRALGVHLEGPYLNLSKKGCHLPQYVRDPDESEWSAMLAAGPVASMTLAPELAGARPLIEALRRNGANASAGHSEALYHEVEEAVGWGVNHVTHLFCAMSSGMNNRWRLQPFRPRAGGLLEAALLDERLTSEVISDGKHLSREMLQVAFRLMGYDRLAIVTDAMRGAGMPDGEYAFGPRHGLVAVVRDGESRVPDGTALASSVCGMNQMVRVFHQLTGCPLWQAVRMGSLTPARILGVADELGSLAKDKQADIILLDDRLEVKATYIAGEPVP